MVLETERLYLREMKQSLSTKNSTTTWRRTINRRGLAKPLGIG